MDYNGQIYVGIESVNAFTKFYESVDVENFDVEKAATILNDACAEYEVEDYDEIAYLAKKWLNDNNLGDYEDELIEYLIS